MHFELTNKSFYKKTFKLMLPVVLQQLISSGINFLDNLMIGGFGEAAISGVSFGTTFFSLFNFICMGLGSGAVVLSSQFWGRRELEPMRGVASIALRISGLMGLLFSLSALFFPHVVLRIYSDEAAIIAAGSPYLRLIGVTFFLTSLASTATYLLRSVGMVRIPIISSVIAFFLNLFFNWVFIFGKLGAPRMEVLGAAVGTVIARVFEFCFIFGYFVLKDERIRFRLKHLFLKGGALWQQYIRYAIPVLISDTLLGLSLSLTSVVLGHVGETMAAATAIVGSMVQIITVVNSATAVASAVVIGNTVGQGDIPRARREGNTYMLLSFLFGLLLILPMVLLEGPYFSAYDITEETRAVAHGILMINCAFLPFQTNAYASSKGVLRGGGDTKFIMFADSGCVWLISLPLGILSAFVWGMSPVWIYFFLRVQYPLKGLICFARYASGKWIKVITTRKVSGETGESSSSGA